MNEASVQAHDSAAIAESLRSELGLGPGVERFASGSVPVFALGGDHAVKLFPIAARTFFDTETAALARVDGTLSIPTPRVVDSGERGGWLYVVMTRMAGCSLAEAWPTIDAENRRQLMTEVGTALAELHALSTGGLNPLAVDWPRFIEAQRASSRTTQLTKGLAPAWADQMDGFLAKWTPPDDGGRALLHTEVMREHLLVTQHPDGWRISGLIDFEPAMIGAPEYDLASVGLFVTCAERGLLRAFRDAYGTQPDDALPFRMLAYALLHRYSNLRWYLERLPVPSHVAELEQLARAWFT